MPTNTEVFKKYLSSVFVETGCYYGVGITAAIQAGYNKIYSIELSPKYAEICRGRFQNNHQVQIIEGDSSKDLYSVIENIHERITFWLDGHNSGGDTAMGDKISPLIEEIEQIGRHDLKNHVIMVDDLRCWNMDNVGFSDKEIRESILKVNPLYTFQYEDGINDYQIFKNDILVASTL